MTTLQQWAEADTAPWTKTNENVDALSSAGIFAKRAAATTGLTWAFFGGLYNGNTIADGTVTLTNAADNYVVVLRSTSVVSTSTSSANSLNPLYAKLYKLTTAGSVVTVVVDQRCDANGLQFVTAPATAASTQGRHAIYIASGSMQPSATGGCAPLARIASAANQPDITSLDFDTTAQEYAQFSIVMPKSWDEGTLFFKAHWSHAATTVNFGVVWDVQAVAVSDLDAIAVAFGTAVLSTDTGGTTNTLYASPESTAITVAGTPANEDTVFFRVSRVVANASDTMAIDARLHGITVYMTTNAETDA